MPTEVQLISFLVIVLLLLGAYSVVRRRAARSDHGKNLGKSKLSDSADL